MRVREQRREVWRFAVRGLTIIDAGLAWGSGLWMAARASDGAGVFVPHPPGPPSERGETAVLS